MTLQVHVRVPLNPSEDPKKVQEAVRNIFPGASLTPRDGWIECSLDSLAGLRALIRKQKILDASRRSLLASLEPDARRATFRLNKQAAFAGRVSFADDIASPLGDLAVTVEGDDLEALFKEMAPMTIRGIPVSEERAEQEIAKRRARRTAGPTKDFTTDDAHEWLQDEEEGPL